MKTDEDKYLMVVQSHNQAMLLYNELLKKECNVELISTPNKLSRGCSKSIIFSIEDAQIVIEEVKKKKLQITSIYKIVKGANGINYINITKN